MIVLRPYQQDLYDKALEALKEYKRVLVQLDTGGGKSIIIAKMAADLPGRTLILTHRTEILEQNAEWIRDVGHLTSKENTVGVKTEVAIAMVQTLHFRIKQFGKDYLGSFDNIILDEVHIQIFSKVFKKIPYKRLIGFTATPVVNKKRNFKVHGVEFVQDVTLSETFDTIVCGVTTSELIDLGYLVQDHNIILKIPDFDKLVSSESQPDGYTTKSLNDVYNNRASIDVLYNAVERYCKGKKTLIFNATTKSNTYVLNALKKKGYNARLFDSVNSKTNEREDVINWFREQKEAMLIGVNVFTTGFNVTDIEVVIVNRATKSLGLWIQMVGRGARTTDKVFKDKFTVIDLGQNISMHGTWSSSRDWKEYFYPGPARRKRKTDLIEVWECRNCGAYNLKGNNVCEICGEERIPPETESNKKDKDGILVENEPIPLPKSKAIIEYCRKIGQGSDFAFKLLEARIIELFSSRNVSRDYFVRRESEFIERVAQIYRPIYFAIIKSELAGKNRRLSTQFDRMKTKIYKYYGIERK